MISLASSDYVPHYSPGLRLLYEPVHATKTSFFINPNPGNSRPYGCEILQNTQGVVPGIVPSLISFPKKIHIAADIWTAVLSSGQFLKEVPLHICFHLARLISVFHFSARTFGMIQLLHRLPGSGSCLALCVYQNNTSR